MIEWIIESVLEFIFAVFDEGENRGERIAWKFLSLFLIVFGAVILGIIWLLDK